MCDLIPNQCLEHMCLNCVLDSPQQVFGEVPYSSAGGRGFEPRLGHIKEVENMI